jgi:hypothetical protein
MGVITTFWSFWGIAEMYHEGWWGAWYNRLPYLAPIALTLIPTLLVFRFPLVGGIIIIAVGLFTFFFFGFSVAIIGLIITLIGGAFILDGLIQRRSLTDAAESNLPWWRQWRYWLTIGGPLVVIVGTSIHNLPVVLTRVDDGFRGARLINGYGVDLVWAPEGPGWNWKQPWGGYPSWQDIALYGIEPVGMGEKSGYGKEGEVGKTRVFAGDLEMNQTNLCLYLDIDGTLLLDEPQNIWRMPTTDEVIRSLSRHGENAGCQWSGQVPERAACDILPDKESPLWATDVPVIYYWTAESFNDREGYFVAYNGSVNTTIKLGGNPRHGYRCVKEP